MHESLLHAMITTRQDTLVLRSSGDLSAEYRGEGHDSDGHGCRTGASAGQAHSATGLVSPEPSGGLLVHNGRAGALSSDQFKH